MIPFAPMWEQLRRVTKPNAAIVLFAAQPFTSALVMSNVREFRYEWIWRKNTGGNFLLARKQPLRRHEQVLVFCRGKVPYVPQKTVGVPYSRPQGPLTPLLNATRIPAYRTDSDGARYPVTVVDFANEGGLHPTQKPVDLLAYLVRTYTNPGETVLDFCMGSGTCGVACVQEGRDFIGIERERAYFDISERRIAAAQPPLFAEVGA